MEDRLSARELRAAIEKLRRRGLKGKSLFDELRPLEREAYRALNRVPYTHITVKMFHAGKFHGTFDGRRWNTEWRNETR